MDLNGDDLRAAVAPDYDATALISPNPTGSERKRRKWRDR
jgi:hypothetical protein